MFDESKVCPRANKAPAPNPRDCQEYFCRPPLTGMAPQIQGSCRLGTCWEAGRRGWRLLVVGGDVSLRHGVKTRECFGKSISSWHRRLDVYWFWPPWTASLRPNRQKAIKPPKPHERVTINPSSSSELPTTASIAILRQTVDGFTLWQTRTRCRNSWRLGAFAFDAKNSTAKNSLVQWQPQSVLKMNSLVFQVVLPHATGNQLQ